MICDVRNKWLYRVGRTMAELTALAGFAGLLQLEGQVASARTQWELYLALALASMVGVVLHELGHLLACRAAGGRVKAFQIGSEHFAIRFRVRTVQVSLGVPYRGQVQYEGVRSPGRSAVVVLSGPLTSLLLAGLALASLPVLGPGTNRLAVAVALGFGIPGLGNLMPFKSRAGRLNDGARLLALRSAARAAGTTEAARTAMRLWREGKATELLELHAGLDVPGPRMNVAQTTGIAMVEWHVALLPGLPRADASLAERRVTLLLRHHDAGSARPFLYLALAMLRLRLGSKGSDAEAEQFCHQALAVKDLTDSTRRLLLAVVTVSREARGLPHEDVRAAAAATLKAAVGSLDGMAASLKAILDPEATLAAFRTGDPSARLGVGTVAVMLRRQGRIGELLEVHAGFGVPEGPFAAEQAQSLHAVEGNLLVVPGVPPHVVDQAANRVQWILDNYPFEPAARTAPEDSFSRPAVEHTLALARLRQGRFAEVEPLCASALASVSRPDPRATVLATIVLARRALGQPHADLLAEATALSPDADLVAEAARPAPAQNQPAPSGAA